MLTEEDVIDLEQTIHEWVDTVPSDEDVLEYAASLPEDQSAIVHFASESYLSIHFQRKDRYFVQANCEEFVQDVTVIDQIDALGNFARYSPGSVIKKLSRNYPSVMNLILPADITSWSELFLKKMETVLKLTTARAYSTGRLYLHSLLKSHNNDELTALKKRLKELFLKEGEAYDTGRDMAQADVDEWRTFYESLKFLPPEQIRELSNVEGYFDRLELNTTLLDILDLIVDTEDASTVEIALWRMAQWRILRAVVLDQESKRRAKTDKGERTVEVYDQLNDIWTLENIRNGQTVGPTRALIEQTQGQVIRVDLINFFKINLVVEAALDPLYAPAVVDNIVQAATNADAEIYITQVSSTEGFDLEQKALLKMLLHQIAQLLRGMDGGYAQASPPATLTTNA